MADAKLRMILSAQDKATDDIKRVSSAIKGVGTEAQSSGLKWTELNSAISIGRQVIDAARQSYEAIIAPTIEYAAQVRNLSRISGESAESTSRLIQVADDMTISYETLGMAARTAAKQDISMSIESLAKLSDIYLKLAPGAERATFLLKTFGKSGLEMGKMLEQGSYSIQKMSAGIEESMIMTQKGVFETRQYEIAQDNLTDSIKGLGYAAGKVAVPALTMIADILTYDINLALLGAKAFDLLIKGRGGWVEGTKTSVPIVTDAYDGWISAIDKMADATEDAEYEMAKAPYFAGVVQAALSGPVKKAQEDYVTNMAALQQEHIKLEANLTELGKHWWSSAEDIDAATTALWQNQQAQANVTQARKDALVQFAIEQAMTGLTPELQLELGRTLGIISEADYAIAKAFEIAKTNADENKNMLIDAGTEANGYISKVQNIIEKLKILTGTEWTITIKYLVEGALPGIPGNLGKRAAVAGYRTTTSGGPGIKLGKQHGGIVLAGETYPVGERGFELYRPAQSGHIIPHDEATAGSNFNFYGAVRFILGSGGITPGALIQQLGVRV